MRWLPLLLLAFAFLVPDVAEARLGDRRRARRAARSNYTYYYYYTNYTGGAVQGDLTKRSLRSEAPNSVRFRRSNSAGGS